MNETMFEPIFAHLPESYIPDLEPVVSPLQRKGALRYGKRIRCICGDLCKQVKKYVVSPTLTSTMSLDRLDTDEYREVEP